MAVGYRLGQLLRGKIFRAPAGVEPAAAEVHRVRAVLDGGGHGLPAAGGREQFHHFFCWSFSSCRLHSPSSALALLASSR